MSEYNNYNYSQKIKEIYEKAEERERKRNFYYKKILKKLPQNLVEEVITSFYSRIFEKENCVVIQKLIERQGKELFALFVYDLKTGEYKFSVYPPKGYSVLYPYEVTEEKVMGVVFAPIKGETKDKYAIEFAIDKNNGFLTEVKRRLYIFDRDENGKYSKSNNFPVTNFQVHEKENKVVWKYKNTKVVTIKPQYSIRAAIYAPFEDIVFIMVKKPSKDIDRSYDDVVVIYNSNGDYLEEVSLPEGYTITYVIPADIIENLPVYSLLTSNPDIEEYFFLLYMVVPDNLDYVFAKLERL